MSRIGLFSVLILGALLSVSAYTDEELEWFINQIPKEERNVFLKHAIIKGYELTEGQSSGIEIPDIQQDVSPQLLKSLYSYFLRKYSIPGISNYPNKLDVICFPSGCIEIGDPGVHP